MVNEWLSVTSCAVHLTFVVLTVMGGVRSSLTLPFALMCLTFFAWNSTSLAYDLSGHPGWFFLEHAAAPFATPLVFHLVVAFTGRLRRLRWVIVAFYVAYAMTLAVPALLAFGLPWARVFVMSRSWAGLHLAMALSTLAWAAWFLFLQVGPSFAPVERASTRPVMLALVIGTSLTATELVADLGVPVLRLGHTGTMFATALMGITVLRFRLFENHISWLSGLQAVVMGALAVGGYWAVFSLMGGSTAMVVWGTTTVTLAVVLTTRASTLRASVSQQRVEHLATLGRFSAQMAHDLKNPLAALKGAVQFLMGERRAGRSVETQDEFMDLLVEQIARMERIVDQYQRLGRVEPVLRRTQVNAIVRSVLAPHELSGADNVEVRTSLTEALPDCELDEDLLTGALENIIRNAFEAMPEGGTLTVKTALAGDEGGPSAVVVSVEDTGTGMDVRVQEKAFSDFFTTKASGSGLGLAFVRRVAEVHGASVELASSLGRGTTVRLRLPLGWQT